MFTTFHTHTPFLFLSLLFYLVPTDNQDGSSLTLTSALFLQFQIEIVHRSRGLFVFSPTLFSLSLSLSRSHLFPSFGLLWLPLLVDHWRLPGRQVMRL